MANFVSLNTLPSEQSSAVVATGFPSLIGNNVVIEQVATPYTQAGVSVVSRIIVAGQGLNLSNKSYGSAQTVSAIATALGAGYSSPVSVYKTINSNGPINVSFGSGTGAVIETVTNMSIGTTPILSMIILPAHGLRQRQRVYYSALTTAALITALG